MDPSYDRCPDMSYKCAICKKPGDHFISVCPANKKADSLTQQRKLLGREARTDPRDGAGEALPERFKRGPTISDSISDYMNKYVHKSRRAAIGSNETRQDKAQHGSGDQGSVGGKSGGNRIEKRAQRVNLDSEIELGRQKLEVNVRTVDGRLSPWGADEGPRRLFDDNSHTDGGSDKSDNHKNGNGTECAGELSDELRKMGYEQDYIQASEAFLDSLPFGPPEPTEARFLFPSLKGPNMVSSKPRQVRPLAADMWFYYHKEAGAEGAEEPGTGGAMGNHQTAETKTGQQKTETQGSEQGQSILAGDTEMST